MEQQLLDIMADVLEVETNEISLDTDFRDDKFDFDSLKGYAILVMIEDDMGVQVSVDDFIASKTIGELLEKVKANG
jgi:acyl carrier protein